MGVHQSVARAAQIFPERAAIVHGGASRTWREFAQRVACRGAFLRAQGFEPGDRIGVLATNVPEHLELAYGALWAQLVLVPLNTRLSPLEQEHILRHAGCKALFYDLRSEGRASSLSLGQGGGKLLELTPLALWGGPGDPLQGLEPMPAGVPGLQSAAAIFYTGGTTGAPKGVELSHGALMLQGINLQKVFGFDETTVYMHTSPLFHLADFGSSLGATYACAAHTFLPDFSPAAILDSVKAEGTNVIALVPTMITPVLDAASERGDVLRKLRSIIYGAAPIPEPVLRRMLDEVPQVRLIQVYGQTELAGACTVLAPEFHQLSGPGAGKLGTAGRSISTYIVRINGEFGREAAPGIPGEICVQGPGMMSGYWNEPELTASAIRDGWLFTGDIGVLDKEGFLTVVGRLKDMIITGGENVFAGEVEAALLKHSEVSAAAVIGVPDAKWGEAVHAVVVASPGSTLQSEELIAHCRSLVAGYKCPRSVEVRTTPLPLSGVGKVRKAELKEQWARSQIGVQHHG